ncbi:MAG: WecB/TagA/CpsF family glycosyltransferase [Myxococcota bacterium]
MPESPLLGTPIRGYPVTSSDARARVAPAQRMQRKVGFAGSERKMRQTPKGNERVDLMGMPLASLRAAEVVDRVFSDLDAGRGGWLVTVNLDILRRHHLDEEARALYALADLHVADGMPLVWASRVRRKGGLPERVAGASLTSSLVARAEAEGRSLYLLGGAPGAARAAGRMLRRRHPSLRLAGTDGPAISSPPTTGEVQRVLDALLASRPDLLLVGLGSPKQEQLIAALRSELPATWMAGVGVTFSFLAGQLPRAPRWMQQAGLEWVHRMAHEPRRLARRYLLHDLPFAGLLFAHALRARLAE